MKKAISFAQIPFYLVVVTGMILASTHVEAGLFTHYTAAQNVQRLCPTATDEDSCIEETGPGGGWAGFNVFWETKFEGSSASVANGQGTWADVSLDNQNLELPRARVNITSVGQERQSAAGWGAQEYLWMGPADTLTFRADIDFTVSGGFWGGVQDASVGAGISVFSDLVTLGTDPTVPFTAIEDFDNSTIIQEAIYFSRDDINVLPDTLREVILSLSFDVATGDSFYLLGQLYGIALNGGYVDAANSMNTSLGALNASDQQVSEFLIPQFGPASTIPVPSSIALVSLGAVGLVWSRRHKVRINSSN